MVALRHNASICIWLNEVCVVQNIIHQVCVRRDWPLNHLDETPVQMLAQSGIQGHLACQSRTRLSFLPRTGRRQLSLSSSRLCPGSGPWPYSDNAHRPFHATYPTTYLGTEYLNTQKLPIAQRKTPAKRQTITTVMPEIVNPMCPIQYAICISNRSAQQQLIMVGKNCTKTPQSIGIKTQQHRPTNQCHGPPRPLLRHASISPWPVTADS